MKVNDIFGQCLHLQRRRRNAGRPYKRHRAIQREWYKHLFKVKLNYGYILEAILKEDKEHEARHNDN